METEETTPTSFEDADTLKLLSSLVSWEEDTGRSMRIKVGGVTCTTHSKEMLVFTMESL